jgi:hypothetical protein
MRKALIAAAFAACLAGGCASGIWIPKDFLVKAWDDGYYPGISEEATVLVVVPLPPGSWSVWRAHGREERTDPIVAMVLTGLGAALPPGAVSCTEDAVIEQVRRRLDTERFAAVLCAATGGEVREDVGALAASRGIRFLPDSAEGTAPVTSSREGPPD